jgi:hypothetical protein
MMVGMNPPPSVANCNDAFAATVGRFTQEAEITGLAQQFTAIVDGVVFAVRKVG